MGFKPREFAKISPPNVSFINVNANIS